MCALLLPEYRRENGRATYNGAGHWRCVMGVSLGLVGLGAFGSEFAGLFKSHPLVDRIALCDREPERIGKFAETG